MSPQPAPVPARDAEPVPANSPRFLWIGDVVLIAAIVAGIAWYRYIPPIDIVIVHSFADRTGRPWISGAITEEIAAVLGTRTKTGGDPRRTPALAGPVARV